MLIGVIWSIEVLQNIEASAVGKLDIDDHHIETAGAHCCDSFSGGGGKAVEAGDA